MTLATSDRYLFDFAWPIPEAEIALWNGLHARIPPSGRTLLSIGRKGHCERCQMTVDAAYAPVLRDLGCELPGQQAMAL